MAWKCILILTVLMMGLVIFTLEVRNNDLTPTSFSHSVLSMQYVHSSKLDRVKLQLYTCFEDWKQHCLHHLPHDEHFYYLCIDLGAQMCLFQIGKAGEKGSPLSECFNDCQKRLEYAFKVMTKLCYSVCVAKHVKG
jgi:hypothetical protein